MRRHAWRWVLPLFVSALGPVAPGCSGTGDNLPREAITGTVMLDGQPLAGGVIQFTAPREGGTTGGAGDTGGSPISNGQFSIDREHGLVPGHYRVTINASGGAVAAKPAEPGRPNRKELPKELIPAKYNAESTLTADVKKGGPNDFKFELQSK